MPQARNRHDDHIMLVTSKEHMHVFERTVSNCKRCIEAKGKEWTGLSSFHATLDVIAEPEALLSEITHLHYSSIA